MNELVSVIMPVFNDEKNLSSAISSVIAQTYENWELLIVNDGSTDRSQQIITEYCNQDARIRLYNTSKPSGSPTLPRNIGLEYAKGRFIAFLDSDDQWVSTKLEHQIALFDQNSNALVVYANYDVMKESGKLYKHPVVAPSVTDYRHLLKGNVIGCLTAMYDTKKTGAILFPYCGHEDYALLLAVLRNGGKAYNTNSVEAVYRMKGSSVSSNKFRAMGWQWNIYRKMEHLSLGTSCYYFVHYAWNAVAKRL
ncbi:MAG: glycosyltransferase family 2 protein [Prevotella sp.]|nr:glycosyltransferase family 2 protein [Prevotella sp.]